MDGEGKMLANLKDWQIFLEVAALKSISKASESLYISQPALSTRLKRLEEELGVALFERSWEGVRLSKEGEYFLPYAVQILQLMDDASNVMTASTENRLKTFNEVINDSCEMRVGIDPWLLPIIMPRLQKILQQYYPNQSLKIITQPSLVLKSLLRYGGLDLCFFYTINDKENQGVIYQYLYDDPAVALFKPIKDKQEFDEFVFSDIGKTTPFVLFDNPTLNHHSDVTKKIAEKFCIEKYHIVNNIYVCLSLINSGAAWTILPQSSSEEVMKTFPHIIENIKIESLSNKLPNVMVTIGIEQRSKGDIVQVYRAFINT